MRLTLVTYLLLALIFFLNLPATAQVDASKVSDFARNYAYQAKKPLAEVEQLISQAEYQPTIIEKMNRPAEKTMTWERYRNIFMKEGRINAGVEFWQVHDATLQQVSQNTGVPIKIILGIIGVETYFGERKGNYRVLDALYTLAFGYPKRASFFKSELAKFLDLVHQEGLDPLSIKGSYAGAMGYCQFMPSSYLAYAKSFDGENGIDLMNNPEDAIASVANYLKVHRWARGGEVAISAQTTGATQTLAKQSVRPKNYLATYTNLGYKPSSPINAAEKVTLLSFELAEGQEYWFCLNNFYVITRYNHSPLYALAVMQLGDAIEKAKSN